MLAEHNGSNGDSIVLAFQPARPFTNENNVDVENKAKSQTKTAETKTKTKAKAMLKSQS